MEDGQAVLKVHFAGLEKESKKSSPDFDLIARKLERTFAYRLTRVYNPLLDVAYVLSEFPALRRRNCFTREAMLCGISQPTERWEQLHRAIPELSKHCKRICNQFQLFERKYMECLNSTFAEEDRKC